MRLLILICKYIYYKLLNNSRTLLGISDQLEVFFSIQKFLILPQIRFLFSIHLRSIFLLFKLWYVFNVTRGLQILNKRNFIYFQVLIFNSKIFKYFSLIYLICIKFIIKFKLRIFRERYKSRCPRFVLRQLNLRFIIFRHSYRRYYKIKHYTLNQLSHSITYHYYIYYYKYMDFHYGVFILFYIMFLFVVSVFSGFMFVMLLDNSSNKYFYNVGSWLSI